MANEYDFQPSSGNDYYTTWLGGLNNILVVGDNGSALDSAVRFTSVTIPNGETVVSADLKNYVEIKGAGAGSVKITVYGIDEDNTSDFTSYPLGRANTTATYNYDRSINVGQYFGMDVTNIVNEIVGRAGWASGNAMGFKMYNNGSSTNVWFEDTWADSSSQSYLSVLINARPEFYPAESTATSADNPAKTHSYGIRIAKDGFDARIATDAQLSFSSSWKVLKAQFYGLTDVSAGVLKQVPHDLGYKGSFLVFGRENLGGGNYGNVQKLPSIFFSATKDENLGNAYIDNSNLNIQAEVFVQGATSMPMRCYYYVFIDDIEL